MQAYFERLVPPRRERSVRIRDAGGRGAARHQRGDARAVAAGEVSPSDAGGLARMVETPLRTFQAGDFGRRLRAIEEALAARP